MATSADREEIRLTAAVAAGKPGTRVPGTMRPYQVKGVWYTPRHDPDYDEKGVASWYTGIGLGRWTAKAAA